MPAPRGKPEGRAAEPAFCRARAHRFLTVLRAFSCAWRRGPCRGLRCKLRQTPGAGSLCRTCSPSVGTWLSLVEHSLGVRGVGSSNLPVPTIFKINKLRNVDSLANILSEGSFSCKDFRLQRWPGKPVLGVKGMSHFMRYSPRSICTKCSVKPPGFPTRCFGKNTPA